MTTKGYRWETPLDWLAEKARTWNKNELYFALCQLARELDSDQLQDLFQGEMDEDGYFDDTRG